MMAQFDFAEALNKMGLNVGVENNKESQLIIDIAIAELQMDSGIGMVCNDNGMKISNTQSSFNFISSSIGTIPIEEQYKNAG
jgi:hypothetical protein